VEFDLEVTIDRPVADVFAYVTNVDNVPEWQESAVSAEWLEEGRRFRERRRFMGREADVELEITTLDRDRRFDVQAVTAPVKFEIRHSFEAVDGRTLLRVHAEAKLGGALRFAGAMAKKQAEAQFRRDFERLKDVLEGSGPQGPGASSSIFNEEARRGKPL
jgi:uncharacterized membrane protein